jgi:quinol monooxygenase YgiN
MIVVIATIHAQAGKDKELGEVLKGLIAPTRKETGCIQYELHVAVNDPCQYAFYERWVDQAALDKHLQTPHFTSAAAQLGGLTDSAPSIVVYTLAG